MVDIVGKTIYIDGTEDNLFSIDIYCKGEDGEQKQKYLLRGDDEVLLHVFKRNRDQDILCVKGPNFLITRDMLSEVPSGDYEYYVTLRPGESDLEFRVTDMGVLIVRDGHRCRHY